MYRIITLIILGKQNDYGPVCVFLPTVLTGSSESHSPEPHLPHDQWHMQPTTEVKNANWDDRWTSPPRMLNATCKLPWWLSGKESTCRAADTGSIPGSGRSSGEGNSNPLQYSCLGNLMDRGSWEATAPGVTKSRTRLTTKHQQQYKYETTIMSLVPNSNPSNRPRLKDEINHRPVVLTFIWITQWSLSKC